MTNAPANTSGVIERILRLDFGAWLYVANMRDNTLSVLDAVRGTEGIRPLVVGTDPMGVAVNGNVRKAARLLRISPSTLYARMKPKG